MISSGWMIKRIREEKGKPFNCGMMASLIKQLLLQFRVVGSNSKEENIKNIIFSSCSLECEKWNRLFFALSAKKQRINSLKRSLSELKVFRLFEPKEVKLYLHYF